MAKGLKMPGLGSPKGRSKGGGGAKGGGGGGFGGSLGGLGGFGGSCGPPYTESYDHEFEPDSGTWPGGVDASHYCKHCGVVGSMHGQGGGAGGGEDGGQGSPQGAGAGGESRGGF